MNDDKKSNNLKCRFSSANVSSVSMFQLTNYNFHSPFSVGSVWPPQTPEEIWLLNAPFCSPVGCYSCLSAVWCSAGGVQWVYQRFLLKAAACFSWKHDGETVGRIVHDVLCCFQKELFDVWWDQGIWWNCIFSFLPVSIMVSFSIYPSALPWLLSFVHPVLIPAFSSSVTPPAPSPSISLTLIRSNSSLPPHVQHC